MAGPRSITRKVRSWIAGLPNKAVKSAKKAISDPSSDSWWRQRTAKRDVCLDWKDVKRCGCALRQVACRHCELHGVKGFSKKAL